MSIKYHMFCVTLCADLRKKVDPAIDIYIAKSSRAIYLTCHGDISLKFVQILEIRQETFDRMCYDTESGKSVDDRIYYLNYHEVTKVYLFEKKVINGTIFYLINFANNYLD